jgi:hypothetical protein
MFNKSITFSTLGKWMAEVAGLGHRFDLVADAALAFVPGRNVTLGHLAASGHGAVRAAILGRGGFKVLGHKF